MAKAKPTLGYPSRTEAVLALRRQRLDTGAIAARIGITPKIVLDLETSASRTAKRQHENCRTVVFPIEMLDALGPHAARRGITANERIVDAALDGNLIDAVLDDATEVAEYLEGAA